MEDSGIQPSLNMYNNVLQYAWKDNSMEHVVLIQERISKIIIHIHTHTMCTHMYIYPVLWLVPCLLIKKMKNKSVF